MTNRTPIMCRNCNAEIHWIDGVRPRWIHSFTQSDICAQHVAAPPVYIEEQMRRANALRSAPDPYCCQDYKTNKFRAPADYRHRDDCPNRDTK